MNFNSNEILNQLHKRLIVSCQAEDNSPFNNPADMVKFAQCAVVGGAAAIRSQGYEKTKAIKKYVCVPVIGLIKSDFDDGTVKITGSYEHVEMLVNIGCDLIAIDGTLRERENLTGPEFIKAAKAKYNCLIMADIATVEEAIACEIAGADCVSTTLNGYTPETMSDKNNNNPNFVLLKQTIDSCKIPVIAEGRFNTPESAAEAMTIGAWAVVVGTAITRPQNITRWFADKIQSEINK